MQSGLGGVVRGAEDVGPAQQPISSTYQPSLIFDSQVIYACVHDPRQTPYLHDTPLGLDQELRKGLTHAHDSQHVRVKHLLHLVDVDIKCRNGVVASGIVDQIIKFPGRELGYLVLDLGNALRRGDVEL